MAEPATKSYHKDALIYIESDEESDSVYVVESGEVALTGNPGAQQYRSALGPGDIFGFTSCLCRRPRMETAVARTDCRCVVLEREKFLESVQSNPELAGRIISYFAQELRAYDDMMTRRSEEASAADAEAHLYEHSVYWEKANRLGHAAHVLEVYRKRFPAGAHAADAAKRLAAIRKKLGPEQGPTQKGLCRVIPDGKMIFSEYEQGDELYIIKKGKVEILKITPPEEMLLSILREGDIFGELAIVSSAARSATAVAAGECLLLPVSRASLSSVFLKSPATVARILATLSQRIWFTFIRLRAKAYANPLTRTYVLLENKLLEERVSLSATRPFTLALGIGEILAMAGVPAGQIDKVKDLLTDDANLTFQFRQVTIESPSALEAKARYYRTRDHLGISDTKDAPRKSAGGRIGLDAKDLRVPPESIP
ncbi:MAG TPA: cyclic nucleotide-binding domain-containing protein [Spirochaetia bacterium]